MHELYTEVKTGKAEDPSPFLTNSTSALIITKPRYKRKRKISTKINNILRMCIMLLQNYKV